MAINYNEYLIIALKIVLSILFGAIIGHERETKNRPAGFRTYTLVCVSTASVMILSELLFKQYNRAYGINADPARLAAQVISGIGFLGAGTIIHHGSNVRGLTTAAGLWAVATLGLIVGSGFYFLSIMMFIALYAVLVIFPKFSTKFSTKITEKDIERDNVIELEVKIPNDLKIIGEVSLCINRHNGKIRDMTFFKIQDESLRESNYEHLTLVKIIINMPLNSSLDEMVEDLEIVQGIIDVDRIYRS